MNALNPPNNNPELKIGKMDPKDEELEEKFEKDLQNG